ncbi:MAG: hypothetical protein KTR32_40290, partial [Granulosicoccus sp.]|nr:hypothetical protein [Granulosicoccus sp.]
MSGTSADGIDAALVYTDGQTVEPTELALTHPYRQQTSDAIWQAVQDPGLLDNPDFGSKLSQCITEDHT